MYFKALLNKQFLKENQDEIEVNDELVDKINEVKVLYVIHKIKYRKALGPCGILVEVWKVSEGMKLSDLQCCLTE